MFGNIDEGLNGKGGGDDAYVVGQSEDEVERTKRREEDLSLRDLDGPDIHQTIRDVLEASIRYHTNMLAKGPVYRHQKANLPKKLQLLKVGIVTSLRINQSDMIMINKGTRAHGTYGTENN